MVEFVLSLDEQHIRLLKCFKALVRRQGTHVSMRMARGSWSSLSSHGKRLGPQEALKKDSRGPSRVAAGNARLLFAAPMNCSQSDSVHGTFQARILEWVAISFSRGSLPARD